MSFTFDRGQRRNPGLPRFRSFGMGLIGLASLTLVVACSNYGTTGSGGTTGAGPNAGASSGAGAGGSLSTPSSGNAPNTSNPSPGGPQSRTANFAPTSAPVDATPAASGGAGAGTGGGVTIRTDTSGTPVSAGAGAVPVTLTAITGGLGSDIVIVTPGASPSAVTPTASVTPPAVGR